MTILCVADSCDPCEGIGRTCTYSDGKVKKDLPGNITLDQVSERAAEASQMETEEISEEEEEAACTHFHRLESLQFIGGQSRARCNWNSGRVWSMMDMMAVVGKAYSENMIFLSGGVYIYREIPSINSFPECLQWTGPEPKVRAKKAMQVSHTSGCNPTT